MAETILLLGHGSRDPDGKRELAMLVDRVRASLSGRAVTAGVLEFADATMSSADDAIDRCAAAGAAVVRVVPILLHTAMHSRTDVPDIVGRAAARHPELTLQVAPSLALEDVLVEILDERIHAAEAGLPPLGRRETAILLIGRGSHDAEANAAFFRTGAQLAERTGRESIVCGFVSLAEPDVPTALEACVRLGVRRVIVAPYFINTGMLVKRIADQVAAARSQHPAVELVVAEHLGVHPRLVELIRARALGAELDGMDSGRRTTLESPPRFPLLARYGLGPEETETLSLRRVDEALDGEARWSEAERAIVRRVVYAGGDPGLAPLLQLHPDAIPAGVAALRAGQPILTDVRMVAVALDHARVDALGARVEAAIAVSGASAFARRHRTTRSAAGLAMLADGLSGGIVVVGNAPTALLAVLDLIDAGRARPALIVATPVGFVAAAEAKQELVKRATPFITIAGTRGGSALAAAAMNALLRLAEHAPAGAVR